MFSLPPRNSFVLWLCSVGIVLFLHIAIALVIFWSPEPKLVLSGSGAMFDMVEGRSKGGEIHYISLEEIIPPEPPKPEPPKEVVAVAAQAEEVADIQEEPPKLEPKPEPKPKEPPKKKPEPKPVKKPQKKPNKKPKAKSDHTNTLKGNGGKFEGAGGQTGDGANAYTSAAERGGYLNNPKPRYPTISLAEGEEGVVTLRVMVEVDGRPSSVEIVKSSGYRRLDKSALETVRDKYRFIPAKRFGVPVRDSYIFNIEFSISNH